MRVTLHNGFNSLKPCGITIWAKKLSPHLEKLVRRKGQRKWTEPESVAGSRRHERQSQERLWSGVVHFTR